MTGPTKRSETAPATPTRMSASAATEAPSLRSFYIFLIFFVVFDVLVIIASIVAQHYTVQAFDDSLAQSDEVTHSQILIQDISRALIEVNASGNDIFENRDLEQECDRFLRAHAELQRRMRMVAPDILPIAALQEAVTEMIEAESGVFDVFEHVEREPSESPNRPILLTQATTLMAEMDRAQAVALGYLREANGRLLRRQQVILDQGKSVLNQRWLVELVFVAVVAVVIGGVWLSWRQIQAMHEQIQLQHERVETERKNRLAAVGEVCFSVAHGIKNPVAAIVSSAQLLLEHGQMDDTSRQRVGDVLTVSRSLGARVSQLLNFSRVGAAQLEQLHPGDVLDAAVGEVGPQLEALGIRIEREVDAVDGVLKGDRHVLVQAILELLANAKDALGGVGGTGGTGGTRGTGGTGGGVGVVRLICKRHPNLQGWIDLGVADNGPGMPDDVKKRAFDLFYTRKTHGSGVGLATVRRAAELHAGTVSIRDAAPHGADIRMHLPLVTEATNGG